MSVSRIIGVATAAACVLAGLVAAPAGPASAAAAPAPAAVSGAVSPTSVSFPEMYGEDTSAPVTVTLTSTGTDPLVMTAPVFLQAADGDDTYVSFQITANTCDGATLDPGEHCSVSVVAHPEALGLVGAELFFPDNDPSGDGSLWLTVQSDDPTTGLYYPVGPARTLDTRSGVGAAAHPVQGGSTVALQVDGRGGLPPTGVAAVVLNLTVTHPTTSGHVTAFPGGSSRPGVSSINYVKGWTGANLLTLPVGPDGQVDLYNSAGSVDLIADVEGWYTSAQTVDAAFGAGRAYQPVNPFRTLDTRDVHGAHQAHQAHQALAPHAFRDVAVPIRTFGLGHIGAVAVGLTGTNVRGDGYLSAGPPTGALTATSTLNLRTGVTTPNLAIVTTAPCTQTWCASSDPAVAVGVIRIYNGSDHPVDVLVDVQGYYTDEGVSALRFQARGPTRIVDTRIGLGAKSFGAGSARTVTTGGGLADYKTLALVANVTAVAPTTHTVITLWASGPAASRPTVSTLNPSPGAVVAVGALVAVAHPDNDHVQFRIYNASGRTDLLVDVTGVFDIFKPEDPY